MTTAIQKPHLLPILPNLIRNVEKRYHLTSLLPYDTKKKSLVNFKGKLKEYKLLLIAAHEAISEFMNGNLSNFDSLVGENACQIRATILLLIDTFSPIEGNLLSKKLILAIKKLEAISIFTSNKQSFEEYIHDHHLNISLDFREIFLICSYLLTKVRILLPPDPSRDIVRHEITDTKKIKGIYPVGSTFARDLIKKARGMLSDFSVRFVQEIANILSIPEPYSDMVSDKYCLSHNKFGRLKCLPCFWYTFMLLKYSAGINLPIILQMKQIENVNKTGQNNHIILYYRALNGRYHQVSLNEFSPDEAAIIIYGSCKKNLIETPTMAEWKQELSSYNIQDLILAYAAAHRQYPDASKDIPTSKNNSDPYSQYKSLDWGCSLENPKLFFLVHAFCDKVRNIS